MVNLLPNPPTLRADTVCPLTGEPRRAHGSAAGRARSALWGPFAVTVAMFLGGCATLERINPFSDSDEEEEGPAKLVDFTPEARVDLEWTAGVGNGLGMKAITLRPAIAGDRIFSADAFGLVQARNRFDGKKIWETRIGRPDPLGTWLQRFNPFGGSDDSFVTGGVGVGGGLVLMGTAHGELVALDIADGSERWRTNMTSEVLAPAAANDDVVLVQTLDGKLVALENDSGEQRWSYDTQVPVLSLRGSSGPVLLEDDIVLAGFASGKVVALRAGNGQLLWERRVALPQGRSELDRIVDVDAPPLVLGPNSYAVSYQGRLLAMSTRDGGPRWEFETSSHVPLAQGYGHIYVVDVDGGVHAVDQTSAAVVWSSALLARRGVTGAVAFGNYVAVGDAEGYLHLLAQSDGRMVARRRIDRDGLRSTLLEADGLLYGIGNDGRLFAARVERR